MGVFLDSYHYLSYFFFKNDIFLFFNVSVKSYHNLGLFKKKKKKTEKSVSYRAQCVFKHSWKCFPVLYALLDVA